MADGVIERQHGNHGDAQRQHDGQEIANVAAAVQIGRLPHLLRNVLDEGSGDNHVVDRNRAGQQHRPDGVGNSDVLHDQMLSKYVTTTMQVLSSIAESLLLRVEAAQSLKIFRVSKSLI